MAVPVINTTTSIQAWDQWQYWEFQPFATETPTSWAAPNLPDGILVDTGTGKISGAAEVAGLFVIGLTATNGTGTSAPLVVTIKINPAAAILTSSATEVEIDVVTREVRRLNGPALTGAEGAYLYAGIDDLEMLFVVFKKNGAILDLPLESLTLGIKGDEASGLLEVSTGFFKKGFGSGAYYLLALDLTSEPLKAELSNFESEDDYGFLAPFKIEWVETNPDAADVGGSVLRNTSKVAKMKITADFVQAV